jgi:ATP-binding cassette subfamily F protein uup
VEGTLHTLEDYLDTWEGAMVVASHDRYFLDRVCDDIFAIESDGSVRHHPGGWSAYWETRTLPSVTAGTTGGKGQRSKAARKKLTYNDQRELTMLTKQIPVLERRRAALTAGLAVMADLDDAETRWLELTELAEQLKSGE